ncbi:hypothetical protein AAE478_000971 [Parahypoxylon ruwenzoriense]
MIMWGTGFFQSDRDLAIAKDLFQMLGRGLVSLEEWKITEDTVKRLNSGLLAENFDKVLSAHFKPHNSRHKREYVAVILGMIAMDFGARIEDRHMKALRLLRPWLPTIDMQLQLVTALDEYKNDGTAWKLERKCPKQLAASSKKDSTEYDLEFWITGVGPAANPALNAETGIRDSFVVHAASWLVTATLAASEMTGRSTSGSATVHPTTTHDRQPVPDMDDAE